MLSQLTYLEKIGLWSLLFIALMMYAIIVPKPDFSQPQPAQYTKQQRAAMDSLIASLQYDETPESKIVYLYGEQ